MCSFLEYILEVVYEKMNTLFIMSVECFGLQLSDKLLENVLLKFKKHPPPSPSGPTGIRPLDLK